ncbi:hypothetical protein niasHT_036533 [Heterodera trifolii]|uniref:Uncharacterized protein n=1 Tax=Heterodera trifolii TaxID=157864 RepID=A0ABD2IKE6_9BILA
MSASENVPSTKKRIRRMIRRGFSRAMDQFQNSLDNSRFRLRNDRKKCAFFLAFSVVLLVGIVFTVANLAKISANASHGQLAFFILFFIIIVTYFIMNTISFVLLCVQNPHYQQEERPAQLGQELGEIGNEITEKRVREVQD